MSSNRLSESICRYYNMNLMKGCDSVNGFDELLLSSRGRFIYTEPIIERGIMVEGRGVGP